MRRQDHRSSVQQQGAYAGIGHCPGDWVHVAGRFVHQHQAGVPEAGAGNDELSAITAAQVFHQHIGVLTEVELAQSACSELSLDVEIES